MFVACIDIHSGMAIQESALGFPPPELSFFFPVSAADRAAETEGLRRFQDELADRIRDLMPAKEAMDTFYKLSTLTI